MKNEHWKKVDSRCQGYLSPFEDEMIHIINTGFKDKYMIVWEDAYQEKIGKVEFHTKESIENNFNINLDVDGELDLSDFPKDEYRMEGPKL